MHMLSIHVVLSLLLPLFKFTEFGLNVIAFIGIESAYIAHHFDHTQIDIIDVQCTYMLENV